MRGGSISRLLAWSLGFPWSRPKAIAFLVGVPVMFGCVLLGAVLAWLAFQAGVVAVLLAALALVLLVPSFALTLVANMRHAYEQRPWRHVVLLACVGLGMGLLVASVALATVEPFLRDRSLFS